MKVRIRFTREGRIRFISHRDTARLMERAFRKLRLPIAYSEGFSPRPKVSFGLALSVGYESEAEYLDVDLVTAVDLEALPHLLSEALPDGLSVVAVAPLERGAASLQQAITCCDWDIEIVGAPVVAVATAVSAILEAPEWPLERERKGKTSVVDVRPAVLELEVVGPTDRGVQLRATLATEQISVRPAELIQMIGSDLQPGRVRRTHQWTTVDGVLVEPIPVIGPIGNEPNVEKIALIDPPAPPSTRPARVQAS